MPPFLFSTFRQPFVFILSLINVTEKQKAMKKIIFTIVALLIGGLTLNAQTGCNTDVSYSISNNGEVTLQFFLSLDDSMSYVQQIDSAEWEINTPDGETLEFFTGVDEDQLTFQAEVTGTYSLGVTVYYTGNDGYGGSFQDICHGQAAFTVDSLNGQGGCNLYADYYITYPTTGEQDGSIYLYVMGGSGMYNYEWNTGDTTSTLENIGEGNYSVTITDMNNDSCSVVLYDIYVYEIEDEDWNGQYVDSFSTVIDTCLPSFNVDTFYLDNIVFNSDTTEFTITWNFIVNGDTFQIEETYQYIEPGYYWLSLGFNCSGNFNKAVTSYGRSVYIYPTVTSIENAQISSITIYPQPAKENINLNLFSNISGNVSVNIYALDGRLISSSPQTLVAGNNLLKLNISTLTNGAYIISIEKANNKLWTGKLLK